ncbi:hypothetical protein Tco_1551066, partial [Tanacetum coccineum]
VNVFSIDELFASNGGVNVSTFLSRAWQAVIWTFGHFIWKERSARDLLSEAIDWFRSAAIHPWLCLCVGCKYMLRVCINLIRGCVLVPAAFKY